MPDENKTETETKRSDEAIIADSPFKDPITVKRNNLESPVFEVFVGARGDWKEKPYAAPQLEDNEVEIEKDHKLMHMLKWLGKTNFVTMVNTWLKRTGQDYVTNATGKDNSPNAGIFSLETFKQNWERLTAAGQKIGEMEESLQREQEKFKDYITGAFLDEYAAASDEDKVKLKANVDARKQRIANIKFQLEQRKASYSQDKNTDEVRTS
jgi:hypothetical protein